MREFEDYNGKFTFDGANYVYEPLTDEALRDADVTAPDDTYNGYTDWGPDSKKAYGPTSSGIETVDCTNTSSSRYKRFLEEDPTAYDYHTEQYHGSEAPPYFPPPYAIGDEVTPGLHDALWSYAEVLSVADHMVLAEGRDEPPKLLHDYRFVPVLHYDPRFLTDSLSSIGTDLLTSTGVSFEYEEVSDGTPYMDGRFGLGLVFQNRLVALCAGGIAEEGPIIQQLQDVSRKTPPPDATAKERRSFRYANGLHGGLDWKATLALGWCELMNQALPQILPGTEGMPTWIQSAENNTFVKRPIFDRRGMFTGYRTEHELLARLSKTYGGTAKKLGGVADLKTHNYLLPEQFTIGRAE